MKKTKIIKKEKPVSDTEKFEEKLNALPDMDFIKIGCQESGVISETIRSIRPQKNEDFILHFGRIAPELSTLLSMIDSQANMFPSDILKTFAEKFENRQVSVNGKGREELFKMISDLNMMAKEANEDKSFLEKLKNFMPGR